MYTVVMNHHYWLLSEEVMPQPEFLFWGDFLFFFGMKKNMRGMVNECMIFLVFEKVIGINNLFLKGYTLDTISDSPVMQLDIA